jgi:hypothetical protein
MMILLEMGLKKAWRELACLVWERLGRDLDSLTLTRMA